MTQGFLWDVYELSARIQDTNLYLLGPDYFLPFFYRVYDPTIASLRLYDKVLVMFLDHPPTGHFPWTVPVEPDQ